MIAFEIVINGIKICEAGIEGLGVLDAMLFSARRLPHGDDELNRQYPPDELVLEVGGLSSGFDDGRRQHLKWLRRNLQVGDEVCIKIKNSEIVDQPERIEEEDPDFVINAKKRSLEKLKKEFGE